MTKPRPWAFAAAEELLDASHLNKDQLAGVALVIDVLGPGPFRRTDLYARLKAGELDAAAGEMRRLAGFRTGPERAQLEEAAALFAKPIVVALPRQPDDPGVEIPERRREADPLTPAALAIGVVIIGVLLWLVS